MSTEKNTIENIKAKMKKDNVKFIKLQFSDLLGVIKHVDVPVQEQDTVLAGKTMFDGSSIEGFARINESDMLLVPDLASYKVLSYDENFDGSKIATFICDVVKHDGTPFEGDPRSILKSVLERAKKLGFGGVNVGLEPEFFLFDRKSDKLATLSDNGGYFYDNSAFDITNQARKEMVIKLQEMGYYIEAAHHEVSTSQHEINFRYADAVKTCDNVQVYKYAIKSIAHKFGLHATFMPKPIANVNGSGMHSNLSLFDKNGKNAFYDENGVNQLSEVAYQFIAGLLKHSKAFTALTNPTINSYKRLVPGFEAPCYITYSNSNRSSMLRIPTTRKEGTRVEVRSVDPTANPYLALASLISAGLDGIENKLTPPAIINDNIFSMTDEEKLERGIYSLPASLRESVANLESSDLLRRTLGDHAFNKFIENKVAEWDEYRVTVHDWELKKFIDLY